MPRFELAPHELDRAGQIRRILERALNGSAKRKYGKNGNNGTNGKEDEKS